MKGIKSNKSVKKQMNKFVSQISRYQKDTFKVLEQNNKSENIKFFCNDNSINYDRMSDVLQNFKINTNEMTEAPILLLEFIKNFGITKDVKVNKALSEINKYNPELVEEYSNMYFNSVSIRINYLHRDDKTALRKARVTASINKRFYNYLVKRNYLIDYRKPENWHPKKREDYYKKLEAQKRGADE